MAVLLAVLTVAGCAGAPPPTAIAPPSPSATTPGPPAAPCLSQADDGLFLTCLHTEVDEIWAGEFSRTGRRYTPARLTVGDGPAPRDGPAPSDGPSPGEGRAPDDGPDRAFYRPSSGIHFPTRYLDGVHATHGPLAHLALTFTMAHETGHHVQFLLHPRVDVPVNDGEAQADCYAGMWAREEADLGKLDTTRFRAAAAAELARLSSYPDETATHGNLDQRLASLDKGLHTGDPAACNVGRLTWR